jgi:hypothetical protein
MMPNNVRNVLNLFDQRELMAIETDSFRFILAIFGINILHYMIRKDKAKVHWLLGLGLVWFPLDNSLLRKQNKRRRDEGSFIREESRSCQL